MDDMIEAMRKAGLARDFQVNEARDRQRQKALRESGQQERVLQNPANRAATLLNLECAEDIRAFRAIALGLLLVDPGHIQEVVRLAHRFKGAPGSKKFIASVLQLRSDLERCDRGDHARIIKNALRGADRTI